MDQIIRRNPGVDPAFGGERVLCCAFTGHRPHKLFVAAGEMSAACTELKRRLEEQIQMLIWEGYSHFICGGAQGVDTYAAEIVLDLRHRYPWITLELAVPYEGQAAMWSPREQQRYARLMAQADIVTYVHHTYIREALFDRNRYMVDRADLLVAAYNGRPGGTAMTIDYARRTGVPVTCITPAAMPAEARYMAYSA